MTPPGARAPDAAPSRRSAFGRGFWNPNPLFIVGGLLVTLIGLALLQHSFVSGSFTAIPEDRFVRTAHDDWGAVTYRVGELKQQPPGRPMVYLLGGSNVRECIPSEQSLAAALSAAGAGSPPAVGVADLGSMNQNFGESMAVVDNVPVADGGVIVIGVNHSRFAYSPAVCEDEIKGRELVMKSPALNDFARARGRGERIQSILPGILGYFTSYVKQTGGTLGHLGLPSHLYLQHKYSQARISTPSVKEKYVHRWLSQQGRPGGAFDQYFAYNGELLDAMVRLAESRGFQVVLMEVPENKAVVGARFDRYKQVYQPFLRDLAAKDGASYVDFVPSLDLPNDDFFDLTHLVEPGRVKWQGALVEAIAPILHRSAQSGAAQ